MVFNFETPESDSDEIYLFSTFFRFLFIRFVDLESFTGNFIVEISRRINRDFTAKMSNNIAFQWFSLNCHELR
jgi:hypothetical protein